MTDWKSTKTLPPVGVEVDIYLDGVRYTDFQVDKYGRWLRNEGSAQRFLTTEPTHWMHIPFPPSL